LGTLNSFRTLHCQAARRAISAFASSRTLKRPEGRAPGDSLLRQSDGERVQSIGVAGSPSPRPSPLGRGRIFRRLLKTQRFQWPDGSKFMGRGNGWPVVGLAMRAGKSSGGWAKAAEDCTHSGTLSRGRRIASAGNLAKLRTAAGCQPAIQPITNRRYCAGAGGERKFGLVPDWGGQCFCRPWRDSIAAGTETQP